MDNNEGNFKSIVKPYKEKSNKGSLRRSVIVPFISGIAGCTVVLATCFGVPSIKTKIIGNGSYISTTSSTSESVGTNKGTIDQVSLSKYSDTAVFSANKILPSIVGIEVTYNVTSNMSSMFGIFGGLNGRESTSSASASGSGIIISEDGYILTNNHVVASESSSTYYEVSEATSVKVKLFDNDTPYDAEIVGKDSQTDLAVLKINAQGLTKAEFANSDEVKVGEFAMAVGNPLDLGTTITCGVISATNREVSDDEGTNHVCIQTDAAINAGNSGGALVNSEGKVIGVNTLKLAGDGVEGIGFAIPINSTVDVTDQLITYNKVKRPSIGISCRDITEAMAKQYNLVVGVYVESVSEFSAAEKAGLKIGDVITEFDGKKITTYDELNEIKNTHQIGDTVNLKINRDGQEMELSLTIGEQE